MDNQQEFDDVPSPRAYVETRLQLLRESLDDKLLARDQAIKALTDALAVARGELVQTMGSTDLRYQQRFEAQSAALQAAFASQQVAMTTAFVSSEKAVASALAAAKEAVQAALAAADRAVSKTETSADNRFGEQGKLIAQQFVAVGEKFEALNKRADSIEARLNIAAGEAVGGQKGKDRDDGKTIWIVIIAVVIGAVVLLVKK